MTPIANVTALPVTNSDNVIQGSSLPGGIQADDDNNPANSFASLFKQLIEKSALDSRSAELIEISDEKFGAMDGKDSDDALNAILPFLEAMGLTREIIAKSDPTNEKIAASVSQLSDTLPTIAVPSIPQEINTANIAESPSVTFAALAGASPLPATISQLATPQLATPQLATPQLATPQLATPQLATPQLATQSSPFEIKDDRSVRLPTQTDPGITEGKTDTPSDSLTNQLETILGSNTLSGKAETVVESKGGGYQLSPATTSSVNYAPTISQSSQPSESPLKVMNISQPMGAEGWDKELGQRIVWMANRSEGKAELVLTPPQMGRVEVSLTVSGDQATASFASANPVVREALESALPRLREALAEAGIQLGQAQVGTENPRQSAQQEKNPDKLAAHPETSAENSSIMLSSDHDSATSGLKLGRGLVDVFA